MSPAHELSLYLASLGVGQFAGNGDWGIHVGREPVNPANAITLYDTGGPQPVNYSINLRQPTIQVRIRTTNYPVGFNKLAEIYEHLNAIATQVIGGNTYIGVRLTTDFLSIGRDDNERHLLTANYQIQRG